MATWPAKTNYATGDVLTATQMNDIGGELNDLYTVAGKAAGVNAIINGDFGVWQRGTSVSISSNYVNVYIADRFAASKDGTGTMTVSQQTFTPGTAPVAGYEGSYFYRFNQSTAGSGTTYLSVLRQPIEDVRTFAGQSVTLSFWAKADATRTLTAKITQSFGSGGSADVPVTIASPTINLTTSWQRFTVNASVPSIAGKTIGTSSYLLVDLQSSTFNATQIYDIWGVQLEAGSTATPFQTATGTKQGELAACQRYAWQIGGTSVMYYGMGQGQLTTQALVTMQMPVTMRTTPSVTVSAAADFHLRSANSDTTLSGLTLDVGSPTVVGLSATVASGLTQGRAYNLQANANTSNYILFNAEL